MDSRYRNLGIIIVIIIVAVALFLVLQEAIPGTGSVQGDDFESDLDDLKNIFSSKGIELSSSLVVDPSFYALERAELVSLKQDLTRFAALSKTDAAQLAKAFIPLTDYAIKRKASFIQGISSETYCANIPLFESRDLVSQEMVSNLQNYQNQMNAFVESFPQLLSGQNSIQIVSIDLATEQELQEGRTNATALLKLTCGGSV